MTYTFIYSENGLFNLFNYCKLQSGMFVNLVWYLWTSPPERWKMYNSFNLYELPACQGIVRYLWMKPEVCIFCLWDYIVIDFTIFNWIFGFDSGRTKMNSDNCLFIIYWMEKYSGLFGVRCLKLNIIYMSFYCCFLELYWVSFN